MRKPSDLTKDDLLDYVADAAKLWLAHDGLWFLEVEQKFGIDNAIELDKNAWYQFTVLEAKRIMNRLGLKANGGIPALIEALGFRLYAHINKQSVEIASDGKSCDLTMLECRVQEARNRKGLSDFPCKPVGIVEYSGFASTIDARIKTECLTCPPDEHPKEHYCKWRFRFKEEQG